MAEVWYTTPSDKAAIVTGRVLKPLSKKLNPIWWFGNDDEQNLDGAEWYMTGKPQWLRYLCWQFRNPLQNFRCYVLGVQDRNYTVVGTAPVMTVQRDDLWPPEDGWQRCTLNFNYVVLSFRSYCGWCVFQWGWQPSGFFGVKFVPNWKRIWLIMKSKF